MRAHTPHIHTQIHTHVLARRRLKMTRGVFVHRDKTSLGPPRDEIGYHFPRSIQLIDPSRLCRIHTGCRSARWLTRKICTIRTRYFPPITNIMSLLKITPCIYIIRIRNDRSELGDVEKNCSYEKRYWDNDDDGNEEEEEEDDDDDLICIQDTPLLRRVTSSTDSSIGTKCYSSPQRRRKIKPSIVFAL